MSSTRGVRGRRGAGQVVTKVVRQRPNDYEVLARVVYRGKTLGQGVGLGTTLRDAELQAIERATEPSITATPGRPAGSAASSASGDAKLTSTPTVAHARERLAAYLRQRDADREATNAETGPNISAATRSDAATQAARDQAWGQAVEGSAAVPAAVETSARSHFSYHWQCLYQRLPAGRPAVRTYALACPPWPGCPAPPAPPPTHPRAHASWSSAQG